MGWFKDLVGFETFFSKKSFKSILSDPSRLITGVDPFSTKLWNGILGTDKKPIVNQLGGPNSRYFQQYADEGGNPTAGQQFGAVADAVAMYYGTAGLANVVGMGANAAGVGGTFGAGAQKVAIGMAANAGVNAVDKKQGVKSSILSNGEGAAPTVGAPVAMPVFNSAAIAQAKKKSVAKQMSNRGRASTIMTDDSERLGG